MQQSEGVRGSIYDLGYRQYEGVRLGRGYAAWSLFIHSLKTAFGIGRGTGSKIIPIGLAVVVLIPAAIRLGIAAIASDVIDVYPAQDYYGIVEWMLLLFTAAAAPELVGRDERNRTLGLYFSRPILRSDYALVKLGALATALLCLTLVPQAVMFVGNVLAARDAGDYLRDNASDIPPIIGAGAVISVMLASVGLAIACQTPRRSFATGGILALFVIGAALSATLIDNLDGDGRRYAVFLSGLHIMRGATYWLFNVTPRVTDNGRGGELAIIDLPGALYVVTALAITAVATLIVLRRYQRIAA